jgi:hypothetical protein
MTETVWKETLKPELSQQVMLPVGAEVICAREQDGQLVIWFRCSPIAPKEPVTIVVVGTGWALPPWELSYIGTVSMADGLMFHIFRCP